MQVLPGKIVREVNNGPYPHESVLLGYKKLSKRDIW